MIPPASSLGSKLCSNRLSALNRWRFSESRARAVCHAKLPMPGLAAHLSVSESENRFTACRVKSRRSDFWPKATAWLSLRRPRPAASAGSVASASAATPRDPSPWAAASLLAPDTLRRPAEPPPRNRRAGTEAEPIKLRLYRSGRGQRWPKLASLNRSFKWCGCERQYCFGARTRAPSSAAACQGQRGS